MNPLKNVRHEKFAQALACGKTLEVAHREAGYSGNRSVASRLLKDANICNRIKELQEETAKTEAITREEIVQFLADVIKTPAGEVHKSHPLCQSFKDTEDCNEIKIPDKLGAISHLLKMIPGWSVPEKVDSKLEIVIRKL